MGRGNPRDGVLRRIATAVLVLGAHVLIVRWLWAFAGAPGEPWAETRVTVYLVLPQIEAPPVSARQTPTRAIAHLRTHIEPALRRPPDSAPAGSVIMVPSDVGRRGIAALDPSVPIAEPIDVAALKAGCDQAYPEVARRTGPVGTVTLLIRVNADGDVSAVRLEATSGFDALDEAAALCISQGRFLPAQGRILPARDAQDGSWQRVRWLWAAAA